jgi:hypothetical protein
VTEAEWLACTDLTAMLEYVRRNASSRKLRLFACACCRFLFSGKEDRLRQTLEVAERLADGQTTKAALRRARQAIRAARHFLPTGESEVHVQWAAFWLAEVAASENAYAGLPYELQYLAGQGILSWAADQQAGSCSLMRDLFGNPFRPAPALDPAWLRWGDGVIPKLAGAIYEDRAFDRLPVLADALEEAGCADGDLLDHLRGPGPHARGCWAVDLLLGKE